VGGSASCRPANDGVVVPMEGWLQVTRTCRIALEELDVRTSRSGGPGGQHANTADTRVEVRFDIGESQSLGPRQRARLLAKLGPVVTATAEDTRSQHRNRELALDRLRSRLAAALRIDRPRRPTAPSAAAREERLASKHRRSETKRSRRPPAADE